MRNRNMQTGVERLADTLKTNTTESFTRQWRDLRNKIDSILLSTTTFKTDETRKACQEIDDMAADKRGEYIAQRWGHICFQKVEPLLVQLKLLENKMSS